MKLTKFDDLSGHTSIDKLNYLISLSDENPKTIYVQKKINGVYCCAAFDHPDPHVNRVSCYTRRREQWEHGFFPTKFYSELHDLYKALFANGETAYFHGELWIPDESLPVIAGQVSVNRDEIGELKDILRFTIFDITLRASPGDQPYTRRFKCLQDMSNYWATKVSYHVSPAETFKLLNANDADLVYEEFTQIGAEGVVYRVNPCYPFESNNPNPWAVKRTVTYTAEGICVGVTEGKGKREGTAGAIVLELPNKKHVLVGGGAGVTDQLLLNLFQDPPLGKQITFSYKELSDDGVPLRPQLVITRDYETR